MSQRPFHPSPDRPRFVGFAGKMGSGKTSAATYLSSKYHFQYRRYSQVLQQWRGADVHSGDRLQAIGWDVMQGGLQVELNARLIGLLDHTRSAAIDGLRHQIDFASLSGIFGDGFELVFLEANEALRYSRLGRRFASLAAFHSADSHVVESHIDDLRSLATLTIANDGPLESLHLQLDTWMANAGMRS